MPSHDQKSRLCAPRIVRACIPSLGSSWLSIEGMCGLSCVRRWRHIRSFIFSRLLGLVDFSFCCCKSNSIVWVGRTLPVSGRRFVRSYLVRCWHAAALLDEFADENIFACLYRGCCCIARRLFMQQFNKGSASDNGKTVELLGDIDSLFTIFKTKIISRQSLTLPLINRGRKDKDPFNSRQSRRE